MADEQTTTTPRTAQVVGLGLIGTSIAAALKKRGYEVTGFDLNEARALRALELGSIDFVGSDYSTDIAVIATPVDSVAGVAQEYLSNNSRPDFTLTDVGSVKSSICAAITDPRFVGGHPMAGSEHEGPDGADPELFEGATWVLTPTEVTDPQAFALVQATVSSLGAETVALAPAKHDALVAVVSHVPHLVAANLMALADDASENRAALLRLAAGGFRDMTRIAAGDPAMWPDVFRTNADAVTTVLDDLIGRLQVAREVVANHDRDGLVSVLEQARDARRNLPARVARPENLVELRVPVLDRPGVLAEVTTVLGGESVDIFDFEIAHSAERANGVLVITINKDDEERSRSALIARGYRPGAGGMGRS